MADSVETGDVEESGISMVELLEEEKERELDAAAVLGAADDTECTYDQGYVKRQALYACVTCCPADSGRLTGVCLACSYHCHEDHELIELYTKRNFCCDCGNSKFPQNACKLLKEKLPENPENRYNHNFHGAYCTCERPYPDPEDTIEDEMIQCCICEDWFHGRHTGSSVPTGDDYSEMICGQCLKKHEFLAHYMGLAVTIVKTEESKSQVDVEKSPGKSDTSSPKKVDKEKVTCKTAEESAHKEVSSETKVNGSSTGGASSTNTEEKENVALTKDEDKAKTKVNSTTESQSSGCKFSTLSKVELPDGALFMTDQWRKQLCSCDNCKTMYKAEDVLFLLDEEDTVAFYEESGKSRQQNHGAPIQRELEALSSLDRVTRTEMVHEYNTLSSSLREYLRKFAENKKVVRDEDIREFFSQLAANKKQRPGSSIQLFCK